MDIYSSLDIYSFLFGNNFPTGFSIQTAPLLIIPPRLIAKPNAVPIITAKITAGIFFISPMELTPIPIEQTPKILVSSELNFSGSLCPNNAPITPPAATDRALIITPIGIVIPRLSKNTDTVQGIPCTVNLQSNN